MSSNPIELEYVGFGAIRGPTSTALATLAVSTISEPIR